MTMIKTAKEDWVTRYATRILGIWRNQHGPLGRVSKQYIEKIKKDLTEDFDDPLKKELIETTY